jgi:hypothetical protein
MNKDSGAFKMTVVDADDLPAVFQPPGRDAPPSPEQALRELRADLPTPLAVLLEEGTDGLTPREEQAFLERLQSDPNRSLREASRSRAEWRALLTDWLKEEANRFMAAAAQLAQK